MEETFRKIAQKIAHASGTVWAFFMSVAVIVLWLISGPIVGYSDTWQLTVNTLTTVITFLMVFIIQNTQNRDSKAIHLQLDELIRAMHGTRALILDIDELSESQLEKLRQQFVLISQQYEAAINRRRQSSSKVKFV